MNTEEKNISQSLTQIESSKQEKRNVKNSFAQPYKRMCTEYDTRDQFWF